MKSSFQFSHLLGQSYSQGNILFSSNPSTSSTSSSYLLSPIGNRLSIFSLLDQSVSTLSHELPSAIARIATVPSSPHLILLSDSNGRAQLINLKSGISISRINFKQPLRDAKFSNDGKYLAVTHGNSIQVWKTPDSVKRDFQPWILHRQYTGHNDEALSINWSKDGR